MILQITVLDLFTNDSFVPDHGFEPRSSESESEILPLDESGICTDRRIRTFDTCCIRAVLYRAELYLYLEGLEGIGPSTTTWQAVVLPLNHNPIRLGKGDRTLEPCLENKYVAATSYLVMVLPLGLGPRTNSLKDCYSAS